MTSLRDLLLGKPTNQSTTTASSEISNRPNTDLDKSIRHNTNLDNNESRVENKTSNKRKSSVNIADPIVKRAKLNERNDMTVITQPQNKVKIPYKRFQRKDFKRAKLFSLGFPRDLMEEAKQSGKTFQNRKRYVIQVKFVDDQGSYHTRNVLFGNVDDKDYVHTKNENTRFRVISRIKVDDSNFLHPNFYRLYLLNSPTTDIYEAFKQLKTHMNA